MTTNDDAVVWDGPSVLDASNSWSWVPSEARSVRTGEYLVVAYPDYVSTPTAARIFGSDRDATQLIEEMHHIARGSAAPGSGGASPTASAATSRRR